MRRRIVQALPPAIAQLEAIVPRTGTPPVKLPAATLRALEAARESLAKLIGLATKLK